MCTCRVSQPARADNSTEGGRGVDTAPTTHDGKDIDKMDGPRTHPATRRLSEPTRSATFYVQRALSALVVFAVCFSLPMLVEWAYEWATSEQGAPWTEGDGMVGNILNKRQNVSPNTFQTYTIVVACIFFFVVFFLWHMPVLRDLISGLKLFVVGTHELFHILVGMMVGGEVISICIDPNLGGETVIDRLLRIYPRIPRNPVEAFNRTPAQAFWSNKAVATLAAGYIGSSIVGFLLIFAAFDIVASKVASFVIGFGLLIPALRVDSAIAFLSIIGTEGVMIGLWFGDHGSALRFFVLFCGVMHLFYVVWDYTDERFFDKVNSSDCSQFTNLLGWPTSGWAAFWITYSALVFTAAVFAGIIVWKKTPTDMYKNAQTFLPTR